MMRRLWIPFAMLAVGAWSASCSGDDTTSDGSADAAVNDDSSIADASIDGAADSGIVDSSTPLDSASPTPPAPADAVGYKTLTFDSVKLGTTAGTWENFNFFGVTQPADDAKQNSDGSLHLSGHSGDSYGATLSTASYDETKPQKFQGLAFGGGGYFEATLSFDGIPDGSDLSPTFWADDVQHTSGFLPETAGHSWIEIDDLETDVASETKWGQSVHNWYSDGGTQHQANPPAILSGNPVSIPEGGTFNQSHSYSFLWVPATKTTQGYVKFYCDRIQVGGTALYNDYDASQPFPPQGSDIGNVIDTLYLFLILGVSDTAYPATVTSVQVWQASDAKNLKY